MNQREVVFGLRLRSKLSILFLFTLVGGPMMYGAYLSFRTGQSFYGILMVLLFFTWAAVILFAIGFKIRLTDSSIHREGLFSPSVIRFSDVDVIHFGSSWSNFYVGAGDKKIYFGKDFEDHEQLLESIVTEVANVKPLEDVRLAGDRENFTLTTEVNP